MAATLRSVPPHVRNLQLGERIRWARKSAGLSHDRLVERLGRSNRGHLIKIEKGTHTPGVELRHAIADACGVPRELLDDSDDEEDHPRMSLDRFLELRVQQILKEQSPPRDLAVVIGTGSDNHGG